MSNRAAKAMSKLKITRQMLVDQCILGPSWISNGRWALHRERVANAGDRQGSAAQCTGSELPQHAR